MIFLGRTSYAWYRRDVLFWEHPAVNADHGVMSEECVPYQTATGLTEIDYQLKQWATHDEMWKGLNLTEKDR